MSIQPGSLAELALIGWGGVTFQRVKVVGETPKRYRIEAIEKTRLSGRCRWIEPGQTALVPKYALRPTDPAHRED